MTYVELAIVAQNSATREYGLSSNMYYLSRA
jgi:hypothetical protein